MDAHLTTGGKKGQTRLMIRFCVSFSGMGDNRKRRFQPFKEYFREPRLSEVTRRQTASFKSRSGKSQIEDAAVTGQRCDVIA